MDTIFAQASAPGRAGVAVIRISGPQAFAIAEKITGQRPEGRESVLRNLRGAEGEVIDQALLLSFPGPNSFTGEDVVELLTTTATMKINGHDLQQQMEKNAHLESEVTSDQFSGTRAFHLRKLAHVFT